MTFSCRSAILGVFLLFSGSYAVAQEDTPATADLQASFVSSSLDSAQETLNYALSLVGIKYKFGGKTPETGMDCSGFVRHVFYQAADMLLPHNARAISMFGKKIAIADLQPGDLVFYNTMRHTYSHVGIYLGDNRFVHASVTGRGVEVVNMKDRYWVKRFNGARRLLASPAMSGFSPE